MKALLRPTNINTDDDDGTQFLLIHTDSREDKTPGTFSSSQSF